MKAVRKPENFDKKSFAEKGEDIYRKNYKKKFEPQENGKVLAIEIENGECFLGDSVMQAGVKARKKYPDKFFYFVRVGHPAVYSIKGYVPSERK